MSFLPRALVLFALALGGLAACSSENETKTVVDDSRSCDAVECPKLTCTCGGFSNVEVYKCVEGVCATTCEEADCT